MTAATAERVTRMQAGLARYREAERERAIARVSVYRTWIHDQSVLVHVEHMYGAGSDEHRRAKERFHDKWGGVRLVTPSANDYVIADRVA